MRLLRRERIVARRPDPPSASRWPSATAPRPTPHCSRNQRLASRCCLERGLIHGKLFLCRDRLLLEVEQHARATAVQAARSTGCGLPAPAKSSGFSSPESKRAPLLPSSSANSVSLLRLARTPGQGAAIRRTRASRRRRVPCSSASLASARAASRNRRLVERGQRLQRRVRAHSGGRTPRRPSVCRTYRAPGRASSGKRNV